MESQAASGMGGCCEVRAATRRSDELVAEIEEDKLTSDEPQGAAELLGCGITQSSEDADGAPGWTRTSGPEIRSLVLYPTELRAPELIVPETPHP